MTKRNRQPKGPQDRGDRPLDRLREFEAQRGLDPALGAAPEPGPKPSDARTRAKDVGDKPEKETNQDTKGAGG